MFLIVKQGQTREIRNHVFLIITQGVIGGDKDFRKKSVGSLSFNRVWRSFENFCGTSLYFNREIQNFQQFFPPPLIITQGHTGSDKDTHVPYCQTRLNKDNKDTHVRYCQTRDDRK